MTLLAGAPRGPVCPSDLDLDEIVAGDLAGVAKETRYRAHLAACARCAERLVAFKAVEPPPFSLVLKRAQARAQTRRLGIETPRARRPRFVTAGASLMAAAAGLVLAWRLSRSPSDAIPGDRVKGGLGLSVVIRHADGSLERVVDEGRLTAGDEMRFSLATATPGYAVVLGLDATPKATLYVPAAPAAAASAPLPIASAGTFNLSGSIVADATPGTERIVALLCSSAIPPEDLRRLGEAALARAGGDPGRVSSLGSGCEEASALVHKQGGPAAP